jgi:hypothetical protein
MMAELTADQKKLIVLGVLVIGLAAFVLLVLKPFEGKKPPPAASSGGGGGAAAANPGEGGAKPPPAEEPEKPAVADRQLGPEELPPAPVVGKLWAGPVPPANYKIGLFRKAPDRFVTGEGNAARLELKIRSMDAEFVSFHGVDGEHRVGDIFKYKKRDYLVYDLDARLLKIVVMDVVTSKQHEILMFEEPGR